MARRSLETHDHSNPASGGRDINPRSIGEETPAESVRTGEATIDNVVIHQDSIGDLTHHTGDRVTVGNTEFETIFDVQDPVNIICGSVVGYNCDVLEVTFEDQEVERVYTGQSRGSDDTGDEISTISVPPVTDVVKLEFRNRSAENEFGWEVITI